MSVCWMTRPTEWVDRARFRIAAGASWCQRRSPVGQRDIAQADPYRVWGSDVHFDRWPRALDERLT
jgi:hypothetical protein